MLQQRDVHHVQLRGFLDSFASLAPAKKEADRAAKVAAAAVGGGAGQAPAATAAASGSAGPTAPNPTAGPSAAGPSAAAAAADDSDEDDLLVTDEKTADELYEVCPSLPSITSVRTAAPETSNGDRNIGLHLLQMSNRYLRLVVRLAGVPRPLRHKCFCSLPCAQAALQEAIRTGQQIDLTEQPNAADLAAATARIEREEECDARGGAGAARGVSPAVAAASNASVVGCSCVAQMIAVTCSMLTISSRTQTAF